MKSANRVKFGHGSWDISGRSEILTSAKKVNMTHASGSRKKEFNRTRKCVKNLAT